MPPRTRRRNRPSPKAAALMDDVCRIVARQSIPGHGDGPVAERSRLEFRKWRLIHKYVHGHPFPTPTRLPRSEQWRHAAERVRDIGEPDILDWVREQADVARNIENGVQDLRPRKNGTCHCLLLEYVKNRKRKALAIYKWAMAADDKATATNDTLTAEILKRHDTGGIGGTENV